MDGWMDGWMTGVVDEVRVRVDARTRGWMRPTDRGRSSSSSCGRRSRGGMDGVRIVARVDGWDGWGRMTRRANVERMDGWMRGCDRAVVVVVPTREMCGDGGGGGGREDDGRERDGRVDDGRGGGARGGRARASFLRSDARARVGEGKGWVGRARVDRD